MNAPRLPQINFQVRPSLKLLYEEARSSGHWVTRLCAAGLLLMVEDEQTRRRALNRLREWEQQYDRASAQQIRDFVQGAHVAMQSSSPDTRPRRKALPAQKTAARGKSAKPRAPRARRESKAP